VIFHILLALADGEKHGYSILKTVEQETAGQVSIQTGTLYRNIKRMLELGLSDECDDRPDPDLDDERRRYYRLTGFGQTVLTAEARRMMQAMAVLRQKHVLGGA
jgi:DNA-binding PadR family transcriptional regulator